MTPLRAGWPTSSAVSGSGSDVAGDGEMDGSLVVKSFMSPDDRGNCGAGEGAIAVPTAAGVLPLTSSIPPPEETSAFSVAALRPQKDHLLFPTSSASVTRSAGRVSGSPSLDRLIQGASKLSWTIPARRDFRTADTLSRDAVGAGLGRKRAWRCRSWIASEEMTGGWVLMFGGTSESDRSVSALWYISIY